MALHLPVVPWRMIDGQAASLRRWAPLSLNDRVQAVDPVIRRRAGRSAHRPCLRLYGLEPTEVTFQIILNGVNRSLFVESSTRCPNSGCDEF
jgi:hypothetical protein